MVRSARLEIDKEVEVGGVCVVMVCRGTESALVVRGSAAWK